MPADAQVSPEAVARALDLAVQAARALAPAGARVSAEAGVLDSRLQLAPCSHIDVHLPAGSTAWGRTRVGLRCTQGATAWNVSLPVLRAMGRTHAVVEV